MRKTVLTAAAALTLAACAPAAPPAPPVPTRAEIIEHGKYIATAIGGCNDCHTVMTPQGPDMTKSLQGAPLIFAPTIPVPWAPVAPAIAGGPAGYTEAQFAELLRTGKRPDGTSPLPPMPAFRMNQADAEAVAAYVSSLPKGS